MKVSGKYKIKKIKITNIIPMQQYKMKKVYKIVYLYKNYILIEIMNTNNSI
jgi:hypothetical protein